MVLVYIIYLLVSVYVTVWVGYKLNTLGEVFLREIFFDQLETVKPVNKLLLVGYYLINIGYVFIMMINRKEVESLSDKIELLGSKIGWIVLCLGLMHMLNMFVFSIIYKIKLNR